jgi:hypothetical protein
MNFVEIIQQVRTLKGKTNMVISKSTLSLSESSQKKKNSATVCDDNAVMIINFFFISSTVLFSRSLRPYL